MARNIDLQGFDHRAIALGDDVAAIELPVSEVRKLVDHVNHDELVWLLDNAQGDVFTGKKKTTYVVIKVVED